MHPKLFEFTLPGIGPVRFDSYMVLLVIGFTLAIWLARREEDASGRNGDRIVDLGIWMLIFGIMGARLLSVLADGKLHDFVHLCTDPTLVRPDEHYAAAVTACTDALSCNPPLRDGTARELFYQCNTATGLCHPPQDCLKALKFWHGGLAYYGGFLFAAPVGLLYARRKKLGVLRIADLTAPTIAFGLFFGRMGCFFNGCCYGAPTHGPWAVSFPGRPHVHPTQLYEAAGALAIFAFLYFWLRPRKQGDGQVFGGLLVLYGVLRFCLEFLRADDRGGFAGLSTSQWIGVPLVALGIWLAVLARRRGRKQPAVDVQAGGPPAAAA